MVGHGWGYDGVYRYKYIIGGDLNGNVGKGNQGVDRVNWGLEKKLKPAKCFWNLHQYLHNLCYTKYFF